VISLRPGRCRCSRVEKAKQAIEEISWAFSLAFYGQLTGIFTGINDRFSILAIPAILAISLSYSSLTPALSPSVLL
jgi:hypothetical protein